MTTELWMLIACTALYWAQIMIASNGSLLKHGMKWAMGNRHEEVEALPAWNQRAHRAVENMKENLLIFAIVVLVVKTSGMANETSALGAQIFFGGRVAHAGVYIAGIGGLRTGVWAVSMVGVFMVASSLF